MFFYITYIFIQVKFSKLYCQVCKLYQLSQYIAISYKKQFYHKNIQRNNFFEYLIDKMKAYDLQMLQNSRRKEKLPNLNKQKLLKADLHNQSLKKIVSHSGSKQHLSYFPKLILKNKQISPNLIKKLNGSFEKQSSKVYFPKNQSKKRQKLLTQGTSEIFTDIEQSFISLTNHLNNQQQQEDTMINFRKKIEQNKAIIKLQIQKKNKQNRSAKRSSSFMKKKRVNSSKDIDHNPNQQKYVSKKTIQTSTQKDQLNQGAFSIDKNINMKKHKKTTNQDQGRKRQKTQIQYQEIMSEKILPKKRSQGLFTDLQVILQDKIRPQVQKGKIQQKKLKSLLQKLYKLKKDKQYQSLHRESVSQLQQMCENSFKKLKHQTNYQDWNKLDFSSTSQITYRRSSFQDELKKITQYTDRNDASLQKYLVTKKQLLKYGFQVPNIKK